MVLKQDCVSILTFMLNGKYIYTYVQYYSAFFHAKGEIKIAVSIEDEANKDLPPAALLYRPVRQYVYGVLFSLAESRKKTERLAFRKNRLPPECMYSSHRFSLQNSIILCTFSV